MTAQAGEYRDAARNLAAATRKLRLMLALAAVDEFRVTEELRAAPSDLENANIFAHELTTDWPVFRAKVNVDHADFPNFVLVALLFFKLNCADVPATARTLGISNSALVRFLKLDKQVWRSVCELRSRFGLKKLL